MSAASASAANKNGSFKRKIALVTREPETLEAHGQQYVTTATDPLGCFPSPLLPARHCHFSSKDRY